MAKRKKHHSFVKKVGIILLAAWVLVEIVPPLRDVLTHIFRPLIYLVLVGFLVYGVYYFFNKVK